MRFGGSARQAMLPQDGNCLNYRVHRRTRWLNAPPLIVHLQQVKRVALKSFADLHSTKSSSPQRRRHRIVKDLHTGARTSSSMRQLHRSCAASHDESASATGRQQREAMCRGMREGVRSLMYGA